MVKKNKSLFCQMYGIIMNDVDDTIKDVLHFIEDRLDAVVYDLLLDYGVKETEANNFIADLNDRLIVEKSEFNHEETDDLKVCNTLPINNKKGVRN